jgi:L-iditol 2-dehydrogenase
VKAIIKYAVGKGKIDLLDVPEPVPGPAQVKIEVRVAGVCGSDLHIYHDEINIATQPPVIIGHEFSGVVAELGPGVRTLRTGDRVTCETTAWSCGRCLQCRLGHHNMCSDRKVVGYALDGCFAKYCVADERQVHVLPDHVDFYAGALTEPLACCVHAVLELTTISPGDLVVLTGPGAIGLLCLQLVKASGAMAVMCGTSQDAERLNLAQRFGADLTINVETENAPEIVRRLTDSQGADVFLECAGAPLAAQLGLETARRGGQYTQVGLFAGPFALDFGLIAYKELKVTGSLGQRRTSWDRALSLLAQGQVDASALVSCSLPMTEWREAFRLFEEKKAVKIVLEPVD